MEIIDRLAFGVRWLGDGCGASKGSKGSSMMDTLTEWKWSASFSFSQLPLLPLLLPQRISGAASPKADMGAVFESERERKGVKEWRRRVGLGIDFGIAIGTVLVLVQAMLATATTYWMLNAGQDLVAKANYMLLPQFEFELENKLASTLATTKCHCRLHTWISPPTDPSALLLLSLLFYSTCAILSTTNLTTKRWRGREESVWAWERERDDDDDDDDQKEWKLQLLCILRSIRRKYSAQLSSFVFSTVPIPNSCQINQVGPHTHTHTQMAPMAHQKAACCWFHSSHHSK